MNAHRNSFRRELGQRDFRCAVPGCGEVANTTLARQIHADIHEARPLDTADLIDEEAS